MLKVLVAERRKEMNVSEEWLAEESGVSVETIRATEEGKYIPRIDEAMAISKALGKKTQELFLLVD